MNNLKICLSRLFLILIISCTDGNEVKKDEKGLKCLENGLIVYQPWMEDKVIPHLGGLVTLVEYKSNSFLVVALLGDSCFGCTFYNCNGLTISQLGISYEDFSKGYKVVKPITNISDFKK